MSRELLKEAAQALETVQHYFPAQDEADKGLAVADVDACQRLMTKIEAYLAEPEPDAEAIAERIERELCGIEGEPGHESVVLDITEAVALIEDYGHRVPRAMLEEIYQEGYATGYTQPIRNTKSQDIERIAAKHGVKVEDAK